MWGTNGEIDYSFSESGSASFAFNHTTQQISVDRPLDRQAKDIYKLIFTATDRGNPHLSTTVEAVVIVLDTNDNKKISFYCCWIPTQFLWLLCNFIVILLDANDNKNFHCAPSKHM